tara:strand:+ start:660 stop:800 length:141 start_codon:yes stop_codon:yes gene_type:complete
MNTNIYLEDIYERASEKYDPYDYAYEFDIDMALPQQEVIEFDWEEK